MAGFPPHFEMSSHSKKKKIHWGRLLLCVLIIGAGIASAVFFWPKPPQVVPEDPVEAARKYLKAPLQSESEDAGAAPALEPLLIRCVGDIMAHMPQVRSAKTGNTYDFTGNYKYVLDYINEADLMMGNFETTFSGDGTYSGYPRFDSPDKLAVDVKKVGFDLVFFSNNHMIDSGLKGVKRSVNILKQQGFLAVVGARENTSDPRSAVVEVKGIKVGVLAYTYESTTDSNNRKINGIPMGTDGPNYINSFRYSGSNINSSDLAAIKSEIKWCRDNGADIVICYFHWGSEYKQSANPADKALAKFAAENGADIIFASHPHVLQPIDVIKVEVPYKEQEESRPAPAAYGELVRESKAEKKTTWTKTVPVYYSMGNFVSNQRYEELAKYYGETKARLTEQGMIANVKISYNRKTGQIFYDDISCIPTWVDRYPNREPYTYSIIPLIGDLDSQPMLKQSGHVSRAKSALTAITKLLGSKYIYKEQ